jgi:hypothetical protein
MLPSPNPESAKTGQSFLIFDRTGATLIFIWNRCKFYPRATSVHWTLWECISQHFLRLVSLSECVAHRNKRRKSKQAVQHASSALMTCGNKKQVHRPAFDGRLYSSLVNKNAVARVSRRPSGSCTFALMQRHSTIALEVFAKHSRTVMTMCVWKWNYPTSRGISYD